jgi:hypothetical protein
MEHSTQKLEAKFSDEGDLQFQVVPESHGSLSDVSSYLNKRMRMRQGLAQLAGVKHGHKLRKLRPKALYLNLPTAFVLSASKLQQKPYPGSITVLYSTCVNDQQLWPNFVKFPDSLWPKTTGDFRIQSPPHDQLQLTLF